jgi:hypothetical protein
MYMNGVDLLLVVNDSSQTPRATHNWELLSLNTIHATDSHEAEPGPAPIGQQAIAHGSSRHFKQ